MLDVPLSPANGPILALHSDGLTFSVQFDRYDLDRCRYYWEIDAPGTGIADRNDDLSAPGEIDLIGALRTLLTFASVGPEQGEEWFPRLHAAGCDLEHIAERAALEVDDERSWTDSK